MHVRNPSEHSAGFSSSTEWMLLSNKDRKRLPVNFAWQELGVVGKVLLVSGAAIMVLTFLEVVLLPLLFYAFAKGDSAGVVVDLGYAQYQGIARDNGITNWLGVRFAAAPINDLRFAPPQDPPFVQGVQFAGTHGPPCLSTGASPTDLSTSEDCLFLDVYAPSGASATTKLPVYFFIQGGGFNELSNANYDGSGLIAASNHSIVVVTINYRVGPYGFLASREVQADPTAGLNNGLLDQRKALEWVQKHITKFGGDPNHVVLGGGSAGAASIALHLSAYGGRDDGLFHAAAAESVSFAPVLTVEESQYQYDSLVSRMGCAGAAPDTIACLRSKQGFELQRENRNVPYPESLNPPLFMWNPVIDGSFIQNVTYLAFDTGAFIKVPLIVGDDTNGGTVFAPRGLSSQTQSNTFLKDQFPHLRLDHFQRINELFPNTGPTFPGCGSWWRQASDSYGEMRYMCPSLFVSGAMARYGPSGLSTSSFGSGVRSWNYRYNVEDPQQVHAGLGVPHVVEISAIWGPRNIPGGRGVPQSYQQGSSNAWVVPLMQSYWTSFIRTYDPNPYRLAGAPLWDEFTVGDDYSLSEAAGQAADGSMRRMLFSTQGGTGMETVNVGMQARCRYLGSIGETIRQ